MPAPTNCAKCDKVLPKKKVYCRCRRFKFCNDECYSERPMREWHREECEKKAEERIKQLLETKAAAITYSKRKLAQEQPRKQNGQFKDQPPTRKKSSTELSEEDKKRRNGNSKASKAITGLKRYGNKLHKVRKMWGIRLLVQRNGVGCKTNPIVYETPNFSASKQYLEKRNRPSGDVSQEEEDSGDDELQENPNDLTFEEGELQDFEEKAREPRTPKYRCYVCHKTTGSRNGYVCAGETSGKPCLMGAACEECINLDISSFNVAERRKIKAHWNCPLHKKASVAPGGDESLVGDQANEVDPKGAPPKSKKPRNFKLLKASEPLKKLLRPIELETKELFTKLELVKGVHQYIKDHPQLKKSDPLTEKVWVHPDDLLRDVYGNEPFQAISKVPQMKDHITVTNLKTTTSSAVPDSNQPTTADSLTTEQLSDSLIPIEASGSKKDARAPKKFMRSGHLRTPVFKAPPRVPPAPKNSGADSGSINRILAILDKNAPAPRVESDNNSAKETDSGECSQPSTSFGASLATGHASNIIAPRETPSEEPEVSKAPEMMTCTSCGFLEYLTVLENNGCNYCNK